MGKQKPSIAERQAIQWQEDKKDKNMYNHLQELLKKLQIEQNEPHRKSGCNPCVTSGKRLCMLR